MAISILAKDNVILRCSNSVLYALHQHLQELIKENNIESNAIVDLINKLDQDTYGLGMVHVDISEYLLTSEELLLLIDLVGNAFKRAEADGISQAGLVRLENFKKNLLVYLSYLKNNGSINRDSFYSPSFWIGGANILYCTNFCLKKLREWLQQLIIKKGFDGDQILRDLMDQLDQSKRDPGYIAVSIDRLFGQTNSLAIFVELITDVCDVAKKDKEISEEDKEALYFFLGRLTNYLEQIRNKIEA